MHCIKKTTNERKSSRAELVERVWTVYKVQYGTVVQKIMKRETGIINMSRERILKSMVDNAHKIAHVYTHLFYMPAPLTFEVIASVQTPKPTALPSSQPPLSPPLSYQPPSFSTTHTTELQNEYQPFVKNTDERVTLPSSSRLGLNS